MKEKKINEMLDLQQQARKYRADLDIAYNIFNNVTDNDSEMEKKDETDPVSIAILELNLRMKKASAFYGRIKEQERLFKK